MYVETVKMTWQNQDFKIDFLLKMKKKMLAQPRKWETSTGDIN